jgi:hypothetical protein
MLKATKLSEGGRPVVDKITGTKMEPPVNDAPTLSDLGIDKKTSSLAQKLATLPESEVTATVSQLANSCTIQTRPLLINRIGGNVGINLHGYPQIMWKNQVRGSYWVVYGYSTFSLFVADIVQQIPVNQGGFCS